MHVETMSRGPDGWSETVCRIDGRIVGIITHPMAGAKWFLMLPGKSDEWRRKFRTRQEAVKACQEHWKREGVL